MYRLEKGYKRFFLSCIAVPLSVSHCTLKDTTLGGYNIPAGTIVFPNLYSACMDTKYWKHPEKFDPERFLDDNFKLIKADVLIPFSIGTVTFYCIVKNQN